MIYAAQIRAARALLNWSQGDLAERAGISKQSVNRIENGSMDARFSTMTALNDAIRGAGVEMGEDTNGVIRLTITRDRLLTPSA
jgi:transcriptional regulator with XRE-family HTH domain